MDQKKILVVEDDKDINDLLCDHLKSQGYQVQPIYDGNEALKHIENSSIDLFLLDWMIPGLSGIQLCEKIRANSDSSAKPIIILTARSDSESIINGLDSGANDYITKPFDLRELSARIRAQIRSNITPTNNNLLRYEDLEMDTESYQLKVSNELIKLTKSEFLLLKALLSKQNSVLSRKELVQTIQGDQTVVTDRTVDTHMAAIRKKIGLYADRIKTIRGIGYKFES